ncbi:MAG: flavodoxin family protein [Deltaproteobacteria bacterium]|nr:flavodoxin family protein [Deltaproteobacteria bacterium]
MKTLVVSGSRNPEGRTAMLINALCRGIESSKGKTEVIYLPQMDIKLCRQCNMDGWGTCRDKDRCIIDDDFPIVLKKINNADVTVFVTPVYFGDLSESMKAFLDRLRRVKSRIPRKPANPGKPMAGPFNNDTGPIAMGLCYAGGSGNGTTTCCMNLERILMFCGFDVVDMLPARRENLDNKLVIAEQTGKWLATMPSSFKCELEPV